MRLGKLPDYQEPYCSDSRDNNSKREKVVTIRSEESNDAEGLSFVKHVSDSQGQNQDSAYQPDLKNTLNLGFQVHRREIDANCLVPTNPLVRPYQIIGLLLPGLIGLFQPIVASPKYRGGQR